jgi:hypothetical protein
MNLPYAVISSEAVPPFRSLSPRDALWEHARNSLGIARLLVQEGRSVRLVSTACAMTIETACRAALEQAGLGFDGDVEAALVRLGAPRSLRLRADGAPRDLVAAAEGVLGWIASYLRREAPEHSWGF